MRYTSLAVAASLVAVAGSSVSHAATITFAYDAVQYAATSNFAGATTVAINQATPTVSVPAGSFVRFGISEIVTNNANPAVNGAYDQSALGSAPQPLNLGIGNVSFTVTNTAPTFAIPSASGGNSVASMNANFLTSSKGDVNTTTGAVGTLSPIGGGVAAANIDASGSDFSKLVIGGGATASPTAQDIFTRLTYTVASTATGTISLLPVLNTGPGGFQIVSIGSLGDANNPPVYSNRAFSAASDTVNTLPSLNIVVTPEPASLAALSVGAIGMLARRRRSI